MARGINKVILIGNLGRDPETRYTQDQRPITNLRIATTDSWMDRNTNERHEQTEWHDVVCFARLAEISGEYLRKGSKVYIEGKLQTRSWEGQDGVKRYRTEVIARDMQMLDSRGAAQGGAGTGGGYDQPPPREAGNREGGFREGGMPAQRSSGAMAGGGGGSPDRGGDLDDGFDDDIPF